MQNDNRKTSVSSIGHMVMTGVFVAVPVLMFAPNLMVAWDYQSISVGDAVGTVGNAHWMPPGNQNIVTRIESGIVYAKGADGRIYKAPIEHVIEL